MAPPAGRRTRKRRPLLDLLPELLVSALAEDRDFILCYETDEETGKRHLHVMTGQFITPCMLRKLVGQAESQRDEGSKRISRPWKPVAAPGRRHGT